MQHVRTAKLVGGLAIIAALVTGVVVSTTVHRPATIGTNGYDTSPGAVTGPDDSPSPSPSS